MRKKNVNKGTKKTRVKYPKAFAGIGPIIMFAAPATGLNLTTLASDLTDYYQEHQDMIHAELELGLIQGPYSIDRNFTFVPGIVDELVLMESVVDDFVHQYVPASSTTFNPTANAIEPSARKLKMRDYEGDLQFLDKVIERSHLMYIGKMKALARTDNPEKTQTFIEYLFWTQIMDKAKRTLRKAFFQATFDDTAPYAWNKIMDGWETLIAAEVTATTITPLTIDALTVSNVITEVERVVDTLDITVKSADDTVVALKSTVYDLYTRANRATLGRNSVYDSNIIKLDGRPNITIIEEPDFVATKIAAYRKSNPIASMNNSEMTAWEWQRADRITKAMINGKAGLQFTSVNTDKSNIAIGY